MQNQGGLLHFLERGAERGEQSLGQIANETDGVRKEHATIGGQRTARTVGSSVANIFEETRTSARLRALNSVDLPALV